MSGNMAAIFWYWHKSKRKAGQAAMRYLGLEWSRTVALNPRPSTVRPDNTKRNKKIEKRCISRAGMRNGDGLMGLSLKSQFIAETRLHPALTPCDVSGLLINPSSFLTRASLDFCYFNQGSHLNQYFSTVLSLTYIILSLIHQEKVKIYLIISNL